MWTRSWSCATRSTNSKATTCCGASRARESEKSETMIGGICISNKIEYRDRLGERVDSSLQDNELVFDPYDATQL